MPFFLSLVYIIITFLSPNQVIPELAPYHPMQILAGLLVLVSLPKLLQRPFCVGTRQFWLAVAFTVVVLLSNAEHLWFGGVLFTEQTFLPDAIVIFLLMLHADTLPRLRQVAFWVWALAVAVAAEGIAAYYYGFGGHQFLYTQVLFAHGALIGQISRIRGPGILKDPNDLSQFLEVAMPLPWLLWRQRRRMRNLVFVYLPTAYLLFAIYLTRSRGALLGLAAMVLFALRRRLGNLAAGALTGMGIAAAFALDFTGGRQISDQAGASRLELWNMGMQMLRSNPIFGVGYGQFTQNSSHTAHNSLVLCLAELGLPGAWVWLALVVTIAIGVLQFMPAKQARANALQPAAFAAVATAGPPVPDSGNPAPAGTPGASQAVSQTQSPPGAETISRWATVLMLSLLAFLVTAFFLSRPYATVFFLTFGMAAGFLMSQHPETSAPTASRPRWSWVRITTAIETAGVVLIYVLSRGH